ncbi:MAG TPA: pyridoxal phosphate-dependent aminotransferase [Ktedonobacteraceae bacterium]|nr:pyridoxal phosphate-dependent aminotransferase [Ktedonobacteraceae bacterium]
MITHHTSDTPDNSPQVSIPSIQEQYATLRQLRSALIAKYRPVIYEGPGPIRVMARIVAELEQACRQAHISDDIITTEIVNRTIGDINLRLVTECEGAEGGPQDYRMLADDLGVALPGEQLQGYTANGATYLWLRNQMMECERLLLANHYDPRIYDIYGVGNPALREWLTQEMQKWGLNVPIEQLYLGLGAMDSIDKVLRGLALIFRAQGEAPFAMLCPEPGFNVPEWQAYSHGYRVHMYRTAPEHHFKLTAEQLDDVLRENPDIRVLYLTITNNPTTFAYSADELNALHTVLRRYREAGRTVYVLGDLAYIGTGKPEDDRARMATFLEPDVLRHTIFISSFSKTFTLTGERFGWVTCGDPALAAQMVACWTNTMATFPGEWQLRFMAYYRLMQMRPWLGEKLRNFYALRRRRLITQLRHMNDAQPLFEEIYLDDDATVYNWSKLTAGEDAFSLFEKTGIAGVPGSGFGYTDQYIRFSVGVIPIA